MSDLHTLLHEMAGPSNDTVANSVADADLDRAHRALRRRRISRMSAGSGLVAAATIGAFVIVGSSSSPSGHDPVIAHASAPVHQSSSGVTLVAYTGSQPTGFVLDKVPAGWAIRDSTSSFLTIAPEGSKPVSGPPGATSVVGTIAIKTNRDTGVPTGVKLDRVTVDGSPAVIAHLLGSGDTRTLFAKQPSGVYLEIQVWSGLGWDNSQIADFAASVHITKDARPIGG